MCPLIKHIILSERAKAFWEKEDIDDVFNVIFGYLDRLKRVLKKNTATDKGWILSVFHDYDQNASSASCFCVEDLLFVHQNTFRAWSCWRCWTVQALARIRSLLWFRWSLAQVTSFQTHLLQKVTHVHLVIRVNFSKKTESLSLLNHLCSTDIYRPKFFKTVMRFKTRCCGVQVSSW